MRDENVATESTRSRLQRLSQLASRGLPSLDQISRSVAAILTRWPDVIRTPEDRDRETLALEMLSRVESWHWDKVTTQRVISAAVAVFDADRRNRDDLEPLRLFYLSEIATRERGAFLDGMVGVYIDSFTLGADHTERLAAALSERKADLGGRSLRLLAAIPNLFEPQALPAAVAKVMFDAENAYVKLQEIGFSTPHTSGVAKEAQHIFILRLAPDLAQADAREKLFNWLTPENGPVLQLGASAAVEALLAVWKNEKPDEAVSNELCERIVSAWNDPRLHSGGIWSGFDPNLLTILTRWLTHKNMKFFCDMVTATQDSHMWPPRRDFWLTLYHQNMIDEAWVALGSDARYYAEHKLRRNGDRDLTRRFGRQLDRNESTTLLIMRIGNKIVVDGCHNYKTHIFRSDDPNAPKLYQTKYYCNGIMRLSPNSKAHNAIDNWKSWVLQHV